MIDSGLSIQALRLQWPLPLNLSCQLASALFAALPQTPTTSKSPIKDSKPQEASDRHARCDASWDHTKELQAPLDKSPPEMREFADGELKAGRTLASSACLHKIHAGCELHEADFSNSHLSKMSSLWHSRLINKLCTYPVTAEWRKSKKLNHGVMDRLSATSRRHPSRAWRDGAVNVSVNVSSPAGIVHVHLLDSRPFQAAP
ncbi:hypothetical protein BDV06DRAFT_141347 [Aspergillus oleicola]